METSIRFLLKITLPHGHPRQLLLRCEQNGEVWASIYPRTISDPHDGS